MAPNGHKALGHEDARHPGINPPPCWLQKHGKDEYDAWRDEDPNHQSSYDEWKASGEHFGGLSLYYATLSIFEESDSGQDKEAKPVKAKPQPRQVRGPSVREPKKKATTNGNCLPRSAEAAPSSIIANSEDLSASAKKKRKARKKPLSEEMIESQSDSGDANGELETAMSVAETATPKAPIITVNGQRKSSAKKSKKKPLSEETISPEDELDDSMNTTIDEVVTPAAASPLPVRSAPKFPAAVPTSDPPKKSHILKLSTRKVPKKKTPSEDNVLEDNGANAPSTVTAVTKPKITVNTSATTRADDRADQGANSAAASPDPTSASAANTRRGLRTRRPAQQRPYYHDAQLFEDVEPDTGEVNSSANPSPVAPSRRVSVASLSRNIDDDLLQELDEEALALLKEGPEPDSNRPKHFKGKGRAWKKEGSDEDEEFTTARKKAAKAKSQPPKKRGRPRKSGRSEETVADQSDSDTIKRKRLPPRRSALSAEVVPDSADEGEEKDVEESYTPKGMPKTRSSLSSVLGAETKQSNGANDDSERGSEEELEVGSPS
ncbi:hypothetical protein EJ02DRAFT_216428 [Clathrospora elynae]|uniref:Uncharacterized protein n=1 Tax=Clathrospora elynae TaxID=706981 RepID=A0A6A5T3L1_9PLEO|nr:hypothetical protein EJ02DRAFT_216428 [Clathrospora elynae]